MRLVQNLPKETFNIWEQLKLYQGALQKPLTEILDNNGIDKFPIKILQKEFPETRNITFVRHLESKYNEYKQLIKQNPTYIKFIQEQDGEKKEKLAQELLSNFFETVGIDYETDLSSAGHQQGEKIWKLYAELIKQHPELFPDIIYVSPYLRTRLTANYLLKNIEGLEINLDQLTKEEKLQDLIIGKFYEKEFALKIDERIRERDHGSNVSPSFLREFHQEKEGYRAYLGKMRNEQMHYYTAPEGWESQVQTNARAKLFWKDLFEKEEYKNILVVSHHLTILGTLLSIMWGSFQTFYQLNEFWKPENGSFTILSEIPETDAGKENKFRIAWYNLSLE